MDGRCDKHQFEPMERLCRSCGGEFCGECLVFAYGSKKPPFCVNCALSAAGVRSTAARPQVRSKREVKRELKEQKRVAKLAAKAKSDPGADLFDARPIPVSAKRVVELEFTINDDGSVNRPGSEPAVDPEPELEAPKSTGSSLFDQVEHQAS